MDPFDVPAANDSNPLFEHTRAINDVAPDRAGQLVPVENIRRLNDTTTRACEQPITRITHAATTRTPHIFDPMSRFALAEKLVARKFAVYVKPLERLFTHLFDNERATANREP